MNEPAIHRADDPCPECGVILRMRATPGGGCFVVCPRESGGCNWIGPPDPALLTCAICDRRFASRVSAAHMRAHGLTRAKYKALVARGGTALAFLRRRTQRG
jgi:hypothetical protein